ncbi:MAG: hypothetical protein KAG66_20205, partial [Methylococcales bacterium]|nr:hypothetical protein [Methylococcales bacterium]
MTNFIIRNSGDGIYADNVADLTIIGNTIGYRQVGSAAGNGGHGIALVNTTAAQIGGEHSSASQYNDINIIAHTAEDGINVASGTGNRLFENRIEFNGELGIDLGADGVNPNDASDDGDTGANGLLNYPVLGSADENGNINGSLFSSNGAYTLYFYRNANCDPSGHGEAEAQVGSTSVTITSGNQAAFAIDVGTLTAGGAISAVTVDASGNTSELSACVTVASVPTAVGL